MSKEYKNARTKLKWKCQQGHLFERTLGHVKEGRGCPICNKRK
ncbi:zinc-ribbon domain-containing protein [Sutcliffiella horikoshii]